MLIKPDVVKRFLVKPVKGVLHVGAHECEERSFYHSMGLDDSSIIWIEALARKVDECKRKGIPRVYQAVMTDKDGAEVTFNVSNNVQSSSILEFGSHARHHPHVVFTEQQTLKTTTIDSFLLHNKFDPTQFSFWNLDIQGAELLALKGGAKALCYADAVYLEVNTEEVYKGCATLPEIDAFLSTYKLKRVVTDITPYGWGDALYVRE